MLETHRRLYNEALEQRITAYKEEEKSLSYYDQTKWFTERRKENEWYSRLSVSSARSALRNVDLAYKAFFRRVKSGEKPGFPRFKGRFNSFTYLKWKGGCGFRDNRLYLQYVGNIKIKLHREIEGEIKTLCIKNEGGKWYAIFSCDLGDVEVSKKNGDAVGIDMGLKEFLTTSDGSTVANPRFQKDSLPELRRKQRALSRKKKGGKNRKKAAKQVARLHAKVANQRRDFHHKTARQLVNRYAFIAAEDLNIKGMVKNRRLSRSISDAAWGGFLTILAYKAESAGCRFESVDPKNTSQNCSNCGRKVPKKLSTRVHRCVCGHVEDRDKNAAKNILNRAWVGPAELNVGVGLRVPRSLNWEQGELFPGIWA